MSSFKQFMSESPKLLYILRGISGSGKSSLSAKLGAGGAVFSTDDYFMRDGQYQFDPSQFGQAHAWNIRRAVSAMEQGISPIVIDNTNVEAWEMKPYVEAGQRLGYQIEFHEPQTSWKFNAEELARRNKHGTPEETIQDMLGKWHPNVTVDDVMNSTSPFDQVK